jgi:hypothetical protein
MNKAKRKLTLSQPATYEIKVPGELDADWLEWVRMTITVESESDATTVSTLTATFDQAALQSILRRLYSLGLPLISVIWIE